MERKRRDKAATRAALLDAARLRFARQGYDGTGVRDIAADVGVDPALVFRYFGSKDDLFEEAVHVEIPESAGGSLTDITAALLNDVVFADRQEFDGEHPLIVMLRSSGRAEVRDRLRHDLCEGYLRTFADHFKGAAPDLRAELVGALLVGIGVMRSVVASPALTQAPYEETLPLVQRLVAALDQPPAHP
ncbi:TetR family transcriptional regulator [Spirillospora sp. NPDC047279]|uniref:TetR/AcrR family transcriptional regulator n=1 Tax=Spirillospora sp. NPDC047279 TaxID=3155478 RepID=UPI0033F81221